MVDLSVRPWTTRDCPEISLPEAGMQSPNQGSGKTLPATFIADIEDQAEENEDFRLVVSPGPIQDVGSLAEMRRASSVFFRGCPGSMSDRPEAGVRRR